MAYKMRLQWFNKKNLEGEGKEFSAILDSSIFFLDKLGLADEPRIYDGVYDVEDRWLVHIQPYFQHQIDLQQCDYQLSFRHI